MAHFSRVYLIGSDSACQGTYSASGVRLQIVVCDGNRQWLEPMYFDPEIMPLNGIRTIVPEGPDHPNALIDALIVFLPDHFRGCPSFDRVRRQLERARISRLDFDLEPGRIPREWSQLRIEALPLLQSLWLYEGDLKFARLPREVGLPAGSDSAARYEIVAVDEPLYLLRNAAEPKWGRVLSLGQVSELGPEVDCYSLTNKADWEDYAGGQDILPKLLAQVDCRDDRRICL